jgi:4'-phosphopantetheinyl transferase
MVEFLNIPLLPQGVVQVWHARAADGDALLALLTDEEVARAERFVFAASRQEYVLGRALVRMVLSRNLSIPPRELQFQHGSYGKPELDCGRAAPQIHFNVSHSAGLVVAAFSREGEVGVDVEEAERPISPAVRGQVFTPEELRSWQSLSPDEHRAAAAARWTLKEAYLKARGAGLNLPLQGFGFEELRIRFSPLIHDDSARWRFYQARLAPRHVVSLAQRDSQAAVKLHAFDTHLSYQSTHGRSLEHLVAIG